MYLSSLEIVGFKSFAQKTLVQFHRGVTAVVGPNGCGKSNVLDAIRWVLGEQSAKALRGGEMADVIFSGTDSRQPLGMAEVSLTFSECEKELGLDYHDVCITRRVFRDGRSEYFINRAPCRLKDIHHLFMDTGIGRSAYSIMEQGKIDQILSSRPEDRRAIFEEAAGITKFKSQKKEALRKLEATEANLIRVTDVMKEVKRQIGSLQRQAAKARRFQTLATDLKILETHHAKDRWDTLEKQRSEAAEQFEKLREAGSEQESQIEKAENELSARRAAADDLERRLVAARESVTALRNHIANAESRIGFNGERAAEFASLADRYRADIAVSEERLRDQEAQLEHADIELGQIQETLTAEQARLAERTAAANEASSARVAIEREVQSIFGEISKLEQRANSFRAELASLAAQSDAGNARLTSLNAEIAAADDAVSRAEAAWTETAEQVAAQEAVLAERQSAARSLDEQSKAASAALVEAERAANAAARELAQRESRIEALRQLNAEGAGLGEGPQAVLRGLDNPDFFKPAVAGALASYLEISPDFFPAVEAALGSRLQAIVLKDPLIAESVLKTLSAHEWGRAEILLRDVAVPSAHRFAALPDGATAWLSDLVGCPSELRPLISALLGRWALVPDIETLSRAAAALASGVSLVTPTGETATAPGVFAAGKGNGQGAALIQRNAEIAALDAEIAARRAAVIEAQARLDALASEVDALRAEHAAARDEAQEASVLLSTLRGQIALLDRERRDASQKSSNLRRERETLEARLAEAAIRLNKVEAELSTAKDQTASCQTRQSELQAALETSRAAEAELAAELNELRVRVATERQRHESLANQRQPMANRLRELRELISQRGRDIADYEARIAALATENARIQEEILARQRESSEIDASVAALAEERGAVVAEIEQAEADLRILRRQVAEFQEQRGKLEVLQTQLQLRADNLRDHISRRHGVDLGAFEFDGYGLAATLRDIEKRRRGRAGEESGNLAQQDPADPSGLPDSTEAAPVPADSTIPWALVEQLVSEFSQKLESMGPVNMDAIQEYDELEQRHGFLEKQITDLENAKTELHDVIAKINRTTREMFADTFEKVRVNFAEMFTELFGGGKANLVLTDDSDPLESGIEIIAKPPGKQLQSISLLSGGEKTMTAVALLFSIYMVKPSPFCVLDEMDAPLDESNIARFIKILDRFVGQSQFVVITHNKRTISRADVIFGVTMEEHGVSKLVGVRLSKREESAEGKDIIGTSNPGADQRAKSIAEAFGKSEDLRSETLQAG